jgi:hypothetical protein
MFFDNPRICMGLNPENRRVIRSTAADEEARYQNWAHVHEKKMEVEAEHIEDA